MLHCKTMILLGDMEFKEVYMKDVLSRMRLEELLDKHNLTYHIHRVLLKEFFDIPMSKCRMTSKQTNKVGEVRC